MIGASNVGGDCSRRFPKTLAGAADRLVSSLTGNILPGPAVHFSINPVFQPER